MRLSHHPSKFEFYNAIFTNCDSNTDAITTAPVLLHNFEYLKNQIEALKKEKEAQEETLIELNSERCKSKEKLCNAATDIVMLSLWGNNVCEVDRKKFYDSIIARDGKILRQQLIKTYRTGHTNLEKLKEFGITAPLLDEFLNMISLYFSDNAAKKRGEIERIATRNFKNLYRKTEAILRAMDKDIKNLKADYPYFFASYIESRKLLCDIQAA